MKLQHVGQFILLIKSLLTVAMNLPIPTPLSKCVPLSFSKFNDDDLADVFDITDTVEKVDSEPYQIISLMPKTESINPTFRKFWKKLAAKALSKSGFLLVSLPPYCQTDYELFLVAVKTNFNILYRYKLSLLEIRQLVKGKYQTISKKALSYLSSDDVAALSALSPSVNEYLSLCTLDDSKWALSALSDLVESFLSTKNFSFSKVTAKSNDTRFFFFQ